MTSHKLQHKQTKQILIHGSILNDRIKVLKNVVGGTS